MFRVAKGLAVLAGLILGCGSQPLIAAPDAVLQLRVDSVRLPGAGSRSRNPDWVGRVTAETLDSRRLFSVPGRPGPNALGVRVGVTEQHFASETVVRVVLDVEVPQELKGRRRGFVAEVEVVAGAQGVDLRQDLPFALERAVAILEAELELERGSSDALTRLLGDRDPELISIALRWAGVRKMREAVDRVVPLLKHKDPRVAVAAVDCLAQIGGPEHAGALVNAARLADREHTRRLYEALGVLGGPQALGFLAFAARNEDDPVLAQEAKGALDVAGRAQDTAVATVERGHR